MLNIYVDGDACPVKDEVMRVAERHALSVYMVSNSGLFRATGPNIHRILVGQGPDAADDWITEHIEAGDIAITADIKLAARCLEKQADVIGPTGKPFTKANIGSALAMREFTAYLREAGEIKGHNPSFTKQDRSQFLQTLEQAIQKRKRTL
ncbi:YaiI/YqxD family protein [bacterium]|nr:YaiI/YqxD family protein [bacterium]